MTDSEKIEQMSAQVSAIHTVLLGYDGQGGVARRVEKLEVEVGFLRSKMAGVAAAISVLGGILGAKITKLFGGQ